MKTEIQLNHYFDQRIHTRLRAGFMFLSLFKLWHYTKYCASTVSFGIFHRRILLKIKRINCHLEICRLQKKKKRDILSCKIILNYCHVCYLSLCLLIYPLHRDLIPPPHLVVRHNRARGSRLALLTPLLHHAVHWTKVLHDEIPAAVIQ